MVKRLLVIVVALFFCANPSFGGTIKPYIHQTREVVDGDTINKLQLSTIFVFRDNRKGRALARKYSRLTNAIRLTYPIARRANFELQLMESELKKLPKEKHKEYVKGVEERLKKQYTPLLKRMSMYQGIVLLKLIDRETGSTSYSLVKELRGSFSAFFWQGIARLFGGSLKTEYDMEGDDKIIEELLTLYKQGMI